MGAWANVDDFAVVVEPSRRVAPVVTPPPPLPVVVIVPTPSPVYVPDPSVRFPDQPGVPVFVYAPDRPVPYVVPPQPYPEPEPVQPFVAPPSLPNLLVNGDFEQTALALGSWQNVPQIAGWFTTFGTGFEIQAGVAGTPFQGGEFIELDGDAPSGIAQDVAIRPRARYELSLAFSARPGTSADDNRIAIYFDGQLVGRLRADGTNAGDTQWQTATFVVAGRTNRARLEIRDEGMPNSLGSYVDDVRLVPVP